jgi:hypothetical protein
VRTQKRLYLQTSNIYKCELEKCLICGSRLEQDDYLNGRKIVQTMTSVMQIGYYAKGCPMPGCDGYQKWLRSAEWQQIAPLNGTYGYDVIASIGWQRQTLHQTFAEIHLGLANELQISESQVRYLYTYHYLPLLACHERGAWAEIERVSAEKGLILTTDGLAPEGGEAQLWVVRELRTGKTLRSGWMSEQGQTAFENFLGPIAAAGLRVEAVISDKQRGLVPAIEVVFPEAKHAFCQSHYLGNIAEPIAKADEAMKVSLRQQVRQEIGALIRPEQVEQPGVLTVTGVLPTPITTAAGAEVPPDPREDKPLGEAETEETEAAGPAQAQTQAEAIVLVEPEQAEIESALKRRIRYLLTLKGRPPFRLAGIEMYERLNEVSDHLAEMLAYLSSPCLEQLHRGLELSLTMFKDNYLDLRQGADWLHQISELLDPQDKPPRPGAQVETALLSYLDDIRQQNRENEVLTEFAEQIEKTTHSYQRGLFHTYDLPDLPRTNNDQESEFRGLQQQLLRTTGQKGGTRRLIQRSGAWELIPRPDSLAETIEAISTVEHNEYKKEQTRVRSHRDRFRFHTRSVKLSRKQLQDLKNRWLRLSPDKLPETTRRQREESHPL